MANDFNKLKDLTKSLESSLGNIKNDTAVKFLEKMGETGLEYVKKLTPVDTGQLRTRTTATVTSESYGAKLVIEQSGYGVFVEYGTGVVGQSSPVASAPAGWKYAYRGQLSWTYFKDGQFFRTQGRVGDEHFKRGIDKLKSAYAREFKSNFVKEVK